MTTLRRRDCLRVAAGWMIVRPWVVGRGGEPPPSERVRIAGIGVGGKGMSDLEGVAPGNEIVALCDADPNRAQGARKKFPSARFFTDFRRMFDEMSDSFDAVVISTPDHIHFPAALWAIRRQKHVLVQKPLTHSIWEARQLTLAARRYRVVSKMGNQGQASEQTRRFIEMIRAGAIGEVREAHIWTDRPIWLQGATRPAGAEAPPPGFDWSSWLGPAPERPFVAKWPADHPARAMRTFRHEAVYHPFVWRGWWDFGTGALGDIGCHEINPIFWALDEMKGPFSVEAESGPFTEDMYPEWSIVTYTFARPAGRPPLKLIWYDGGRKPPRPEALEPERDWEKMDHGELYIGERGVMLGSRLLPEAAMREYAGRAPPPSLPRSPGHYEEWIAAIKGAPRVDNSFDHAGPLTELVLAGNIAIRTRQKLDWDPAALRFTNSDEANRYVRREYRAGYDL
ncbi:MAG: Gfo/Idh/MocA family oxidoreductase [Kiritimatiellae bacterium]|nr:Gfo/Idh/MocA family oxidoreductase [Kiritimatiellia bacterium]